MPDTRIRTLNSEQAKCVASLKIVDCVNEIVQYIRKDEIRNITIFVWFQVLWRSVYKFSLFFLASDALYPQYGYSLFVHNVGNLSHFSTASEPKVSQFLIRILRILQHLRFTCFKWNVDGVDNASIYHYT